MPNSRTFDLARMTMCAVLWLSCPGRVGWCEDAVVDAEALPASTLLVTNESQLHAAARLSARTDINILVDRLITIRQPVYFPRSNAVVRLIGVTDDAGIHFDMKFSGDWKSVKAAKHNGLKFNCRQAVIRGLRFSGFEWYGAAIKGHVSSLLDVSDCDFEDIGVMRYSPRVAKPRTADDAITTQCIAAHRLDGAHVSVVDCRFRRCALGAYSWSHCLYISAGSVTVVGNRFTNCGNPFAIGGNGSKGTNNIFGNIVESPGRVVDRNGAERPPYLCKLDDTGRTAFMFNTISGLYSIPWTGTPIPSRHIVDFNDYQAMNYARSWAADTHRGVSASYEQWRRMGFDNHSRPPRAVSTRHKRNPDRDDGSR